MVIGIIGAMKEEVSALIGMLKEKETKTIAGRDFHYGKMEGKDVIVCQSGVGKVNMALCAQALIDEFHPDCLVNTGLAGALVDDIKIGEIVLATDTVEHDVKVEAFGYPIGQVPQMDIFAFPCDDSIRKTAKEACEYANPSLRVFEGRIVSGDEFIGDATRKIFLRDNFKALCCEMEGAALAHVCYLNKVSCLVFRIISDNAECPEDEDRFEEKAAAHSIDLLTEFVKRV